jgi:hypothetical protein
LDFDLCCSPPLTMPSDERLGKMFKVNPQTEDVYVFQNNGPSFDSA